MCFRAPSVEVFVGSVRTICLAPATSEWEWNGHFLTVTAKAQQGFQNTVVSKLITDRDFFWEELISDYRYRIALPEELISITETDLWEFQQKISHYTYRFSLKFQLIAITDKDFGLKTNSFCNYFGYNGRLLVPHPKSPHFWGPRNNLRASLPGKGQKKGIT